MRLNILALADNAVGERDVRPAALQFAYLKARAALAPHTQPAAIASRCQEHVVVAALDHLREVSIDLHDGTAALELRRAEILKPVLRALHTMKHPLAAVGERHHPVF